MANTTSTSRKAEDISQFPTLPPTILRKGGVAMANEANPTSETEAAGLSRSRKNKQAGGTAAANEESCMTLPKWNMHIFSTKVVSNSKAATPKTPKANLTKESNYEEETEENGEDDVDFFWSQQRQDAPSKSGKEEAQEKKRKRTWRKNCC